MVTGMIKGCTGALTIGSLSPLSLLSFVFWYSSAGTSTPAQAEDGGTATVWVTTLDFLGVFRGIFFTWRIWEGTALVLGVVVEAKHLAT